MSDSEGRGQRLVKQSIVYFGLSAYRIVVGMVGLYFFSHILNPEEFGVLALVTVFTGIVSVFANAGFVNGLIRYFNSPEADGKKGCLISSALWGNIGVVAVVGITLLVFTDELTALIFGEKGTSVWLWLSYAITVTSVISTLPLSVWRMEERTTRYVVCDGLNVTLTTLTGILLVIFGGLRVNGVLMGQAIAQGVMAAVMLGWMISSYSIEFRASFLIRLLRFGAPFILIHGAYWIMDWSDQFILKELSTLKEVGIYSLGYKLGLLALVIVEAYNTAALPHLFSIYQEDNARVKYGHIATAYSAVMMAPFLLICLAAPVYFKILTPPEFHAAVWVVPFVAFAYSLRGLYNSFAIGVQLEHRLGYLFIIEIFWAAMNIILNIILIPHWQAMGAAFATAITFGGLLVSMIVVNQLIYPIVVEWGKIVLPIAIAISHVGVFYAFILNNVTTLSLQVVWILVVGGLGISTLYYFAPIALKAQMKDALVPYLLLRARKV